MIRAVLFDWGGTLAEHPQAELEDLWRAAAGVLAPGAKESMVAALIAVETRAWARTTTTMRSTRLMDLLREAGDELDVDVAEAVIEVAHDAHLDAWTATIHHKPSAAGVLGAMREAGLRTGLLSNTHWPRSFHERFLERDGLSDLIEQRLYTSEIDWMKPHPIPFTLLAERLDVAPEDCVFVGDRAIDDIQGAGGVGMRTVWMANDVTPGDPSGADAHLDDLADLPALLQSWT
ncbi:hypothetical protein BH23ACT9_BH23ACT9_08950 [soil metagenome]